MSLDSIVVDIVEWQRETFPKATTHSRKTHLSKELKELKTALDEGRIDWLEVADVLFMIIALADGEDVDLEGLLEDKFDINKNRVWGEPDEDGVVEHVRYSYENTEIVEIPRISEAELEELKQLNIRAENLIKNMIEGSSK